MLTFPNYIILLRIKLFLYFLFIVLFYIFLSFILLIYLIQYSTTTARYVAHCAPFRSPHSGCSAADDVIKNEREIKKTNIKRT